MPLGHPRHVSSKKTNTLFSWREKTKSFSDPSWLYQVFLYDAINSSFQEKNHTQNSTGFWFTWIYYLYHNLIQYVGGRYLNIHVSVSGFPSWRLARVITFPRVKMAAHPTISSSENPSTPVSFSARERSALPLTPNHQRTGKLRTKINSAAKLTRLWTELEGDAGLMLSRREYGRRLSENK